MWWTICLVLGAVNAVTYDSFSGQPASKDQLQRYKWYHTTSMCTNDIKPCDPEAWRRVDGSCNNLNQPQRGASHTPPYRILPRVFSEGYTNRKSVCGCDKELKPPREIRYETLLEGKTSSTQVTQLSLYFKLFMSNDVGSILDILNYLNRTTYCCQDKGKYDVTCTPNLIYKDDPVHRFTNIRCMNLTSPYTFQYFKCRSNDTTPVRYFPSTPLFDLSNLYNNEENAIYHLREYRGGRLKVTIANWLSYPLSGGDLCFLNENRRGLCHKYNPNGVMGANIFLVWFYRLHNIVARNLEKINPCWDDEKLFYTAREICIAGAVQIYYYQLLPFLFGKQNLLRDKVITESQTYRDPYDSSRIPQVSDEYTYTMRWFHTGQDATLKLYDENFSCYKTYPMVNVTTKTDFFPENELGIAVGGFLQAAAKLTGHTVHPDIAQVGLGGMQRAFDITAADLAKGRLFGFAPYVKYLEFCRKKKFETFDDLLEVMDFDTKIVSYCAKHVGSGSRLVGCEAFLLPPDCFSNDTRINQLKTVYDCPQDIDLMAGLWAERVIDGGHVPTTLYCLMTDQLLRSAQTDRHWYERQNRPHAFTPEQLAQIRHSNMGKLLCRVVPGLTRVTQNPFRSRSDKNRVVSCDELPEVDFNAWKDC